MKTIKIIAAAGSLWLERARRATAAYTIAPLDTRLRADIGRHPASTGEWSAISPLVKAWLR